MKNDNSNDALGVLTTGDLNKIGRLIDSRLDSQFEVKVKPFIQIELAGLEANIQNYIHQGTEAVMGGLDDVDKDIQGIQKHLRVTRKSRVSALHRKESLHAN